jgi:hypothetical protein
MEACKFLLPQVRNQCDANDMQKNCFGSLLNLPYPFAVPLQDNGSDCGVYVCRYSLGVYKLRHCDFRERDIFPENLPRQQRLRQKVGCQHLITTSREFDFTVQDIQEMRREFQRLIENLSKVYGHWQKGTKRNAKFEMKDDRKVLTIKEVNIDVTTASNNNNNKRIPPRELRPNKELSEVNPSDGERTMAPPKSTVISKELIVYDGPNDDEKMLATEDC